MRPDREEKKRLQREEREAAEAVEAQAKQSKFWEAYRRKQVQVEEQRKLEKTASLNAAFDTSKKAWDAVQQRPKVTIPNDVFRYDKFPDYNTNNVDNHRNGVRIDWLEDFRHMLTMIPHGVRKITVSDDDANKVISKLKELASIGFIFNDDIDLINLELLRLTMRAYGDEFTSAWKFAGKLQDYKRYRRQQSTVVIGAPTTTTTISPAAASATAASAPLFERSADVSTLPPPTKKGRIDKTATTTTRNANSARSEGDRRTDPALPNPTAAVSAAIPFTHSSTTMPENSTTRSSSGVTPEVSGSQSSTSTPTLNNTSSSGVVALDTIESQQPAAMATPDNAASSSGVVPDGIGSQSATPTPNSTRSSVVVAPDTIESQQPAAMAMPDNAASSSCVGPDGIGSQPAAPTPDNTRSETCERTGRDRLSKRRLSPSEGK